MSISEKLLTVAENVPKVYMAGASDFGLKGKAEGELVRLSNIHPIEHETEVKVSSKNIFNQAKADITEAEDHFVSNISYGQGPCLTIPVEGGATYTCSCEYYTPNTTQYGTQLAYSISKEKIYTWAGNAYFVRVKTQDSSADYSKVTNTFTVPDGVEEVYFLADKSTQIKNLQIEKGTTATDYAPFISDLSQVKVTARGKNVYSLETPYNIDGATPTEYTDYIEPAVYTPNADGTVLGVKSISPVMNLSTDTKGAIVSAECFLDPEAVIKELSTAIISIGGEI